MRGGQLPVRPALTERQPAAALFQPKRIHSEYSMNGEEFVSL